MPKDEFINYMQSILEGGDSDDEDGLCYADLEALADVHDCWTKPEDINEIVGRVSDLKMLETLEKSCKHKIEETGDVPQEAIARWEQQDWDSLIDGLRKTVSAQTHPK